MVVSAAAIIWRSASALRPDETTSAAAVRAGGGLDSSGNIGAAGPRLTRYSWPIPSLSEADLGRRRPAGDGWLLVGDAAGLVDPITREGIYYALASAELAATSLLKDGAGARYAGQDCAAASTRSCARRPA